MARKFGIIVCGLCMVFVFVCKANAAQQATTVSAPIGQGEGSQLRQEIQSLIQQAEPIRAQIQKLEAQIKPLREQLRLLHEKIRADKEKLRDLRGEHRKKMRDEHQAQQQSSTVTQKQ